MVLDLVTTYHYHFMMSTGSQGWQLETDEEDFNYRFCNFVKTTASLIPKTIAGPIQNYCFALSKSHFLP